MGRSRASSSVPPPAGSVPSGPAAGTAFGTNIAMNAFMLVEDSGVITSRAEGNKDFNLSRFPNLGSFPCTSYLTAEAPTSLFIIRGPCILQFS